MILASGLDLADLRDANDWLAEKLDAAAWEAERDAALSASQSLPLSESSS